MCWLLLFRTRAIRCGWAATPRLLCQRDSAAWPRHRAEQSAFQSGGRPAVETPACDETRRAGPPGTSDESPRRAKLVHPSHLSRGRGARQGFFGSFRYHESTIPLLVPGGARNINCQIVIGSFFSALGIQLLYGRTLVPGDELHASDALPVVLRYGFWARNYELDPSIAGKPLTLLNGAFTIGGVMTREFHGVQLETGRLMPTRISILTASWITSW